MINDSQKSYFQSVNAHADIIAVTYYPLNSDFTLKDPNVVTGDFDQLVGIYGNKNIYFTECGYPSSEVVNSSSEKQKEFISEVFNAWDKHSETIKQIDFNAMHDASTESVSIYLDYYGVDT